MDLRSWSNGLSVDEESADYLAALRSAPSEMMEPGNRVYVVRGQGWAGHIVGGIVTWIEFKGVEDDPSPLIPSVLS